jgi:hypothetical protein
MRQFTLKRAKGTNVWAKPARRVRETFVCFASPFEKEGCRKDSVIVGRPCDCAIPAWSAGIQIDMDVCGRIPRALLQ